MIAGPIRHGALFGSTLAEGAVVQIGLVNGDRVVHHVVFPDFKAASNKVNRKGLAGFLVVEGNANPAVFHSDGRANMSGH